MAYATKSSKYLALTVSIPPSRTFVAYATCVVSAQCSPLNITTNNIWNAAERVDRSPSLSFFVERARVRVSLLLSYSLNPFSSPASVFLHLSYLIWKGTLPVEYNALELTQYLFHRYVLGNNVVARSKDRSLNDLRFSRLVVLQRLHSLTK